jgi:hypothetical protein
MSGFELDPTIFDIASLEPVEAARQVAIDLDRRPTVIGGLLVPNTLKVVLIYPQKAKKAHELGLESLIYPQGGINEDESVADAYVRDIVHEELGIDPGLLKAVHGLDLPELHGGHPRDGKQEKGYVGVCGILDAVVPLHSQEEEVAGSLWVSLERTLSIFGGQQKRERRKRNLAVTKAITQLFINRYA